MTSVGKTSQVSARIKIINREPTLRLSWITVLNRPPHPSLMSPHSQSRVCLGEA